jgi:hypothetical protein
VDKKERGGLWGRRAVHDTVSSESVLEKAFPQSDEPDQAQREQRERRTRVRDGVVRHPGGA